METYDNYDDAYAEMKKRNKNLSSRNPQWVVVDGPDDGEATIMLESEAQDNDFSYRWAK
jgi:hypothetical protein